MKITRPMSSRPIPEDAKRVFAGKLFEVYQWPQKMFDGSIATFEGIRRNDSVSVLPVTKSGKIMLGEQEQPGRTPFIGAFGGRMDNGEEPLMAAKRELLEETGCKASRWELWFTCQPVGKIDWATYIFVAKNLKKVADQNLDPGEKIKIKEYGFDEFIKATSQEIFRDWDISLYVYRALNSEKLFSKIRKIFQP